MGFNHLKGVLGEPTTMNRSPTYKSQKYMKNI